jgi:hypothetical protein
MSVENLPVCTTTTLHPSQVISVPSPTKFTARLPFYEHCKVMLDDPAQEEEIKQKMRFGGGGAGIAFYNALVQYRGGEISIPLLQDSHDPNRKISSLAFVDCTFDLMATQNPSPQAEEILWTLLLNTSGDFLLPPASTVWLIPPSPK